MVCEKCKKEIQDKFCWCPYCGAKIKSKELTPFTRLQWFMSKAGRKDAKSSWDYMKSLDFEGVEQYLSEKLPGFDVYTVSGSYVRIDDWRRQRETRRCVFSSIEKRKALELIAREKKGECREVIFYPNKRGVTSSDIKYLCTNDAHIFLTEQECNDFIDCLIKEGEEP